VAGPPSRGTKIAIADSDRLPRIRSRACSTIQAAADASNAFVPAARIGPDLTTTAASPQGTTWRRVPRAATSRHAVPAA
jgi:hypothetical protein